MRATSWTRRRRRNSTIRRWTIARRCNCSVRVARSASMRFRRTPKWCRSILRTIRSRVTASMRLVPCAVPRMPISTRSLPTMSAAGCSSAPTPTIARAARPPVIAAAKAPLRTRRGRMAETQNDANQPLLVAEALSKNFGRVVACREISFTLYSGEVLAIVGESGSGKSTLLQMLSAQMAPSSGRVSYRMRDGVLRDLNSLGEAERRLLFRTDWGYVHQDSAQGLRMAVSAGANVGERLMAVGWNHYGRIRDTASSWLERVEIDTARIDDAPRTYSGGMRQRLQIARNLVTEPRLVFMDEPTGGLDVSVQARLLDLMRSLVGELGLAAIVVTHDLAVARLLSHRVMVMKGGQVIETGLTDQVLDDPHEPYTQLLVSSILPP